MLAWPGGAALFRFCGLSWLRNVQHWAPKGSGGAECLRKITPGIGYDFGGSRRKGGKGAKLACSLSSEVECFLVEIVIGTSAYRCGEIQKKDQIPYVLYYTPLSLFSTTDIG